MTRSSRIVRGLLAAAVSAITACKDEAPPPPTPLPASGYVPQAAAKAEEEPPPALRYRDVTREAGVDFVHETGAFGKKLLPETMGGGVACVDYDGDGDDDLYFTNGDWWPGQDAGRPRPLPRLYRNDGDFRFVDVTAAAGLAEPFYGMGATAADADGDGDQDLFVAGVGGYRFYRNDGAKFVDHTTASGIKAPVWKDEQGREHGCFATSCAWFDADGDRLPDLFVGHYVQWSEATDIFATLDGKNKSYAEPDKYQGESCRLFKNLGGLKFKDATSESGMLNPEGKTLGVCIVDFDEDGDPDVAIANDKQPNYLYRNRGDGTFENIADAAGVGYAADGRVRAGMGIDSGYVGDRQGRCAIAVGNFSSEPVTIYERRTTSDEFFIRVEDVTGVALATNSWLTFGLLFVDGDQDGRDDLVVANGHLEPSIQQIRKEIPYEEPLQFLRNIAGKRFVDVSAHLGPDFGRPRVGRALAYSDLDSDGDLDFVVTVNGKPPSILRCEAAPHSALRVRIVGRAPGLDGLGTKVTADVGGRRISRTVRTGSSYLSCSEKTLAFGLGSAGVADRLIVEFPGGKTRELPGPHRAGTIVVKEE